MGFARPAIRMEIEGLGQLLDNLSNLPTKVEKRVTRKALNRAAKPVVRMAKTLVPRRTGLLRKSIGVRPARISRKRGTAFVVVGPRRRFLGAPRQVRSRETGKVRTVTPVATKYAHLVERGTSRSRAYEFMGMALRSTRAESLRILSAEIRAGIAAEARKAKS